MLKLHIPAAALLVALAVQSPPVTDGVPSGAEFPPDDTALWWQIREGLVAKAAADALASNPGAPETVQLLARAKDIDGILKVLQRTVESEPERIPDMFEAAAPAAFELRGDSAETRQRAETLRGILADARRRLTELPREDAARAERVFINFDAQLNPAQRNAWREALARLVETYRGTRAARLAEVDLISAGAASRRMFDELDALIAANSGTDAAAKALYQKGFQWHTINTLGRTEPRVADPIRRFERVVEIVAELQSGRYPPSEWVDKAPDLITGFFIPRDAPMSAESNERLTAVFEELVRKQFAASPLPLHEEHPSGSGVGYLVTSKLADLYARTGDRAGGVERLLASLERSSAEPSAVRYLRALFYARPAERETPEQREAALEKAARELRSIGEAGTGLYHRKALATLANLEFQRGNDVPAREAYRRYADTYPQSDWAWVALIRAGHCEEELGNDEAAAAMYLQAAGKYRNHPSAYVLGHEFAARAFERLGGVERAIAERERALAGWDNAFGLRYTTSTRRRSTSPNPFEFAPDMGEVRKESLPIRIAELKRALTLDGGVQVEQGRSLMAKGRFDDAMAVLQEVVGLHPDSPAAEEARALVNRSRLEQALTLADAEPQQEEHDALLQQLDALANEPVDFGVTAARIARASLWWIQGHGDRAREEMSDALTAWHTRQRPEKPSAGLEADVAEIRRAVFLPRGGAIYRSGRWNAFRWLSSDPRFMIVNADVPMKLHDGEAVRLSLVQELPVQSRVIFLDSGQIALLKRIITTLGGRKRREPAHVMETPNQPIGDSTRILKLWNEFFPARPGHWSGWELETYPVITEIRFGDRERTNAAVRVTIGYSGATVELEKEDGKWIAKRLTGFWVT